MCIGVNILIIIEQLALGYTEFFERLTEMMESTFPTFQSIVSLFFKN